jgi:hypothetical protein
LVGASDLAPDVIHGPVIVNFGGDSTLPESPLLGCPTPLVLPLDSPLSGAPHVLSAAVCAGKDVVGVDGSPLVHHDEVVLGWCGWLRAPAAHPAQKVHVGLFIFYAYVVALA